MVGRDNSPIVTTVAPTMPVEAANKAPTRITEMPSPPRILPNNSPIFSNKSSAMRERSNIVPMKINNGTAISTSLRIVP